MTLETTGGRERERGSALVISVLVMAILTLLGISYVLMADTENRIAENEKLGAQALYFGEGVVREVKRWFDRPPYGVNGGNNLVKPATTDIDRTLRMIDTDGAGPTAAVAADGTLAAPYYKGGIDRDADGNDDIFDKPYRPALADALLGTETGPDIRISRAAGGNQATLLNALATKVAPSFPDTVHNVSARIDQIDIYSPPYILIGAAWTRYGMATVKATVTIYKTIGAVEQPIATKIVKAVLNETPYPGPYGPLQSCMEIKFNGDFFPHWGTSTAVGDLDLANGSDNKMPKSIPRAVPPTAKIDLLYGWDNAGNWTTLKTNLYAGAGAAIDDPWYRFIVGGASSQWPAGQVQAVLPGTAGQDWSNKMHHYPGGVTCPEFDYDTWKQIAQSGNSDTHYYSWNTGTNFQQNGVGPVTDILTLTDNKTGLFFFDTTDGAKPHNIDVATGLAANLTPQVKVSANYGVRGFMYVNTTTWTSQGSPGRSITMHWPGEPFLDRNQNGVYDTGDDYLNLNYSAISTTDPTVKPVAKQNDLYLDGGTGLPQYNARGPNITGQNAIVWGVLYVQGDFDCQGTPLYYGAVVTKAGSNGKMAGTPDLYWDTDLKDNWPPPTWDLPRVIITQWQTDL
jgi:hypothetical protein